MVTGSVNCMIGASLFTSRLSLLSYISFSVKTLRFVLIRSVYVVLFFFLQRWMWGDTLLVSLLICV